MGGLKLSMLAPAAALILGCSGGQAPAPATSSPPPPAPAPGKTVFDPLTRDVDRAREVQGVVDANAAAQRRTIEEQERGEAPSSEPPPGGDPARDPHP